MQLLNTNSTSYKKIKELGEGSFGEVFLVENIKTGQMLVSKEMRLQGLDEATTIQLYTEAKVLETIKHPNIIEMHDTYRTKSNKLVLILEYASNGDLSQYIKKCGNRNIDEEQIRLWIIQLCLALKHSHDYKVVHRDLKTCNVFLDSENHVKLGDFGLAKNLVGSRQNGQGMAGTPLYLSPEAITKGVCSFKGDVWSLGVVLHELCSLKNPFSTSNYANLIYKICNEPIPPVPDTYTPELREFITMLLERDDKKRPTIRELFETDLIQKTLMKHKDEFKKLISATTLSNIEFNDNGMKKDFAKMKVYRFSEYKDPTLVMQNIQRLVNREEKASRFKPQKVSISEVDDDDEEDESSMVEETVFVKGAKRNIFEPIDGSENEQSKSLIREASDEMVTLSQLRREVNASKNEGKLLSVEEIAEVDSQAEASGSDNQIVSFYNSVMKSVFDRDTKNSNENRPTFDTTHKTSKFYIEKNRQILDSLFDNKSTPSSSLNTPKASDNRLNKEALSQFRNSHIDSEDIDIDDGNSGSLDAISYNYTYSKRKESPREPNFMNTFDSTNHNDALNSPRSEKQKPNNSNQKSKKSFFMQYKDKGLMQSPMPAKFKISTSDRNKIILNHRHRQQSVEIHTDQKEKADEFNTPVKDSKKGFLVKTSTKEMNQFNSEKKEPEFKLKLKGSLTGVKKPRVIKLNLNSIADLPNHNTKIHSTAKKTGNIRINNKCKTITSLNNLNSLNTVIKKVNSKTSNISERSTDKDKLKAYTSIINNMSGNLDEYGLSIASPKPDTHKNTPKGFNPLGYKDIKKIYRTSKVNDLEQQKLYYMEKYGNKFNLVYSAIKKFLVHYGLKNVEKCIKDEDKILEMLELFADSKLTDFRGHKSVVELVKLSILEIKCDLL